MQCRDSDSNLSYFRYPNGENPDWVGLLLFPSRTSRDAQGQLHKLPHHITQVWVELCVRKALGQSKALCSRIWINQFLTDCLPPAPNASDSFPECQTSCSPRKPEVRAYVLLPFRLVVSVQQFITQVVSSVMCQTSWRFMVLTSAQVVKQPGVKNETCCQMVDTHPSPVRLLKVWSFSNAFLNFKNLAIL